MLFSHSKCYPPSDQRYASVSIHAHVTDPLVELSSQVVVLPPTHCQSYSAASIYIRYFIYQLVQICYGKFTL